MPPLYRRDTPGAASDSLERLHFRIFEEVGGTGIEPATWGFGGLGAVSRVVQSRPESSRGVCIALEFALFGDASSNGVQARPTSM
jgi:hypothetical protein